MNLDELERIAKEATPGPRIVLGNIPFYAVVKKPSPSLSKHDDRPEYWRYEDGVFHATFTPEVILSLIEQARKSKDL